MALPNNRRIFDMAAHTWKQPKTILSMPVEMPANWFKQLGSLTIHGSWPAQATLAGEVSVDGEQFVGFDLGRHGGDYSCIVQRDGQRVQACEAIDLSLDQAEIQRLIGEYASKITATISRRIDEISGAVIGTSSTPAQTDQPSLTLERLRGSMGAVARLQPRRRVHDFERLAETSLPPFDRIQFDRIQIDRIQITYYPDTQAAELVGPQARVHGHYLCEFCFDQMTDQVLPAAESPTGLAMGRCGCLREPAQ